MRCGMCGAEGAPEKKNSRGRPHEDRLLAVSERPLTDAERHRVRVLSRELVESAFPGRAWTLGIARSVSLDTPALGSVDFVSS